MSNIFFFFFRLTCAAKKKILSVGLQSLIFIAAGGGAFAVNASPSSVTQNGLAWLSSQVQASGGNSLKAEKLTDFYTHRVGRRFIR